MGDEELAVVVFAAVVFISAVVLLFPRLLGKLFSLGYNRRANRTSSSKSCLKLGSVHFFPITATVVFRSLQWTTEEMTVGVEELAVKFRWWRVHPSQRLSSFDAVPSSLTEENTPEFKAHFTADKMRENTRYTVIAYGLQLKIVNSSSLINHPGEIFDIARERLAEDVGDDPVVVLSHFSHLMAQTQFCAYSVVLIAGDKHEKALARVLADSCELKYQRVIAPCPDDILRHHYRMKTTNLKVSSLNLDLDSFQNTDTGSWHSEVACVMDWVPKGCIRRLVKRWRCHPAEPGEMKLVTAVEACFCYFWDEPNLGLPKRLADDNAPRNALFMTYHQAVVAWNPEGVRSLRRIYSRLRPASEAASHSVHSTPVRTAPKFEISASITGHSDIPAIYIPFQIRPHTLIDLQVPVTQRSMANASFSLSSSKGVMLNASIALLTQIEARSCTEFSLVSHEASLKLEGPVSIDFLRSERVLLKGTLDSPTCYTDSSVYSFFMKCENPIVLMTRNAVALLTDLSRCFSQPCDVLDPRFLPPVTYNFDLCLSNFCVRLDEDTNQLRWTKHDDCGTERTVRAKGPTLNLRLELPQGVETANPHSSLVLEANAPRIYIESVPSNSNTFHAPESPPLALKIAEFSETFHLRVLYSWCEEMNLVFDRHFVSVLGEVSPWSVELCQQDGQLAGLITKNYWGVADKVARYSGTGLESKRTESQRPTTTPITSEFGLNSKAFRIGFISGDVTSLYGSPGFALHGTQRSFEEQLKVEIETADHLAPPSAGALPIPRVTMSLERVGTKATLVASVTDEYPVAFRTNDFPVVRSIVRSVYDNLGQRTTQPTHARQRFCYNLKIPCLVLECQTPGEKNAAIEFRHIQILSQGADNSNQNMTMDKLVLRSDSVSFIKLDRLHIQFLHQNGPQVCRLSTRMIELHGTSRCLQLIQQLCSSFVDEGSNRSMRETQRHGREEHLLPSDGKVMVLLAQLQISRFHIQLGLSQGRSRIMIHGLFVSSMLSSDEEGYRLSTRARILESEAHHDGDIFFQSKRKRLDMDYCKSRCVAQLEIDEWYIVVSPPRAFFADLPVVPKVPGKLELSPQLLLQVRLGRGSILTESFSSLDGILDVPPIRVLSIKSTSGHQVVDLVISALMWKLPPNIITSLSRQINIEPGSNGQRNLMTCFFICRSEEIDLTLESLLGDEARPLAGRFTSRSGIVAVISPRSIRAFSLISIAESDVGLSGAQAAVLQTTNLRITHAAKGRPLTWLHFMRLNIGSDFTLPLLLYDWWSSRAEGKSSQEKRVFFKTSQLPIVVIWFGTTTTSDEAVHAVLNLADPLGTFDISLSRVCLRVLSWSSRMDVFLSFEALGIRYQMEKHISTLVDVPSISIREETLLIPRTAMHFRKEAKSTYISLSVSDQHSLEVQNWNFELFFKGFPSTSKNSPPRRRPHAPVGCPRSLSFDLRIPRLTMDYSDTAPNHVKLSFHRVYLQSDGSDHPTYLLKVGDISFHSEGVSFLKVHEAHVLVIYSSSRLIARSAAKTVMLEGSQRCLEAARVFYGCICPPQCEHKNKTTIPLQTGRLAVIAQLQLSNFELQIGVVEGRSRIRLRGLSLVGVRNVGGGKDQPLISRAKILEAAGYHKNQTVFRSGANHLDSTCSSARLVAQLDVSHWFVCRDSLERLLADLPPYSAGSRKNKYNTELVVQIAFGHGRISFLPCSNNDTVVVVVPPTKILSIKSTPGIEIIDISMRNLRGRLPLSFFTSLSQRVKARESSNRQKNLGKYFIVARTDEIDVTLEACLDDESQVLSGKFSSRVGAVALMSTGLKLSRETELPVLQTLSCRSLQIKAEVGWQGVGAFSFHLKHLGVTRVVMERPVTWVHLVCFNVGSDFRSLLYIYHWWGLRSKNQWSGRIPTNIRPSHSPIVVMWFGGALPHGEAIQAVFDMEDPEGTVTATLRRGWLRIRSRASSFEILAALDRLDIRNRWESLSQTLKVGLARTLFTARDDSTARILDLRSALFSLKRNKLEHIKFRLHEQCLLNATRCPSRGVVAVRVAVIELQVAASSIPAVKRLQILINRQIRESRYQAETQALRDNRGDVTDLQLSDGDQLAWERQPRGGRSVSGSLSSSGDMTIEGGRIRLTLHGFSLKDTTFALFVFENYSIKYEQMAATVTMKRSLVLSFDKTRISHFMGEVESQVAITPQIDIIIGVLEEEDTADLDCKANFKSFVEVTTSISSYQRLMNMLATYSSLAYSESSASATEEEIRRRSQLTMESPKVKFSELSAKHKLPQINIRALALDPDVRLLGDLSGTPWNLPTGMFFERRKRNLAVSLYQYVMRPMGNRLDGLS